MGFNFKRLKSWLSYENLQNSDLNNEFNNILQKAGADTLSGANSTNGSAATVAAMQATSNPGSVGSENLALTLQQDIQQLRYMVDQITGGAQWYSTPSITLSALNGIASIPQSRIISGRVPSGNNQPMFLVPDGTAATVYLKAAATNFSAYFNGSLASFSSDITTTGLSLAPSSNNTCTVNDATLAGGNSTKVQGENGTSITISSLGSNISSLDTKFAAFKHGTEYFIAQVENGTVTYATPTATTGVSVSATMTSGGNVLTGITSTVGIYIGMAVTGVSIGTNATVTAVGSNFVVVSVNSTGSTTNSVTFLGTQLTSVSSVTGISVGMSVAGTGIPANTYVTAINVDPINGNTLTLNNATTAAGSVTCTFTWYRLKNAFRGIGFNSSDTWIARTTISNSDTITLMKLTWVFATYNSSTPGVAVSYNEPVVSYAQPSSPASGDYWYNLSTNTWSVFNGSSYVSSTVACFIGICIQDTSGCKAARSADFFRFYSTTNTMEPSALNLTNVYVPSLSSRISVYGNQYYFDKSQPIWNTTSNLASGVTLSASTTYYCYVTDTGNFQLDIVQPVNRKYDLAGSYHPAFPWRCVADFGTDSSSNILPSSFNIYAYHEKTLPSNILAPQAVQGSQIANGTITGTQLAVGAVGIANRALPGQVVSSSTGTFSTSSASYTNVTNATVTITTHGHPVMLFLQPDGTSNVSIINISAAGFAQFQLVRDGVVIYQGYKIGSSATGGTDWPPGGLVFLDTGCPTSGSHTYQLQVSSTTPTVAINYCVLVAYEI